jgi:hypothetical protein
MSWQELQRFLERGRQKLFAVREKRIHPFRDDKILTDVNGLMVAALAKGAQVLGEPSYAEAASRSVDFILKNMCPSEGRLLHRYRDGQAAIPAYLNDYAFLIWGLIELYGATFKAHYLGTALELNGELLNHFWDDKYGGFYFTAEDSESLLIREKEIYDGALPSGNSIAMFNLLRLARMSARHDLEERVARMGRAFSRKIKQAPSLHTQLMVAVDFSVGPTYQVVIAGNSQAKDTKVMVKELRAPFIPNKIVILRPMEEESPQIIHLAQFTKHLSSLEGRATAYVCLNYTCKKPTTDINTMLELLNVKKLSRPI